LDFVLQQHFRKLKKVRMRPKTTVKNCRQNPLKSKLSPICGIIRDKKDIPRQAYIKK